MRAALLLLTVSACASSSAPGTKGQPRTDGEPESERSADAAENPAVPEAATPTSTQDSAIADFAITDFAITAPRTDAWVATPSGCRRLSFRPRDPESGIILMAGIGIHYSQHGDMLDLRSASRHKGDGAVTRRCRTGLRLGPGKTLGGVTVFDDEASCTAAPASTPKLDDSAEATAAKCRGETLAVTTDEVECGVGERYAVLAGRPGCIGVAIAGLPD